MLSDAITPSTPRAHRSRLRLVISKATHTHTTRRRSSSNGSLDARRGSLLLLLRLVRLVLVRKHSKLMLSHSCSNHAPALERREGAEAGGYALVRVLVVEATANANYAKARANADGHMVAATLRVRSRRICAQRQECEECRTGRCVVLSCVVCTVECRALMLSLRVLLKQTHSLIWTQSVKHL